MRDHLARFVNYKPCLICSDDNDDNDDGGGVATQAPSGDMQQAQGIVQRAMAPQAAPAPMGNGGGFFRTLLGTLLQGAMSGAQQPSGPNGFQRGMQAANANPNVNKQLGQQQADQQASQKQMQQLQMAQMQLNMLHTYHMMAGEDQEKQDKAYDNQLKFAQEMQKNDGFETVGGETDDARTAQTQLVQLKKQEAARGGDPNSLMRIPSPTSSSEDKKWLVVRMKRGVMSDDASFPVHDGNPDKGVPAQKVDLAKGTSIQDANSIFQHQFKDGWVSLNQQDKTQPVTQGYEPPTVEGLRQHLSAQNITPPKNLDDLFQIANEGASLSTLPKKSEGGVLGQDMAPAYIVKRINSQYDPKLSDRAADEQKTLVKAQGNFADEGGAHAAQAIQDANRVITWDKAPPALKKQAQDIITKAQPFADQYHAMELKKANAKGEGGDLKEAGMLNAEIDKAVTPYSAVTKLDEGKVEDLGGAIDMLNKGGGEYDAVSTIKTLRGTVGGGGVRITGAELNALSQARGWTGNFEVWLNNVTSPKDFEKLSSQQRTQLKDILNDAYGVVKAKDDVYNDAIGKIQGAYTASGGNYKKGVTMIRAAQQELNQRLRIQPRNNMSAVNPFLKKTTPPAGSGAPAPANQ